MEASMRVAHVVWVAVAIVAVSASAGLAQSRGLGRVTGVVLDDSGAPVANVEIKTTTLGGNAIQCQSDAKGKWTLGGVGRGEWIVSFTKAGFETKRIKAIIEREIDRSEPVKITLKKGA
jgi:hypothetical protein